MGKPDGLPSSAECGRCAIPEPAQPAAAELAVALHVAAGGMSSWDLEPSCPQRPVRVFPGFMSPRSPSSALLSLFLGEGSPTKID